jgi:hypothetical protein
MVLPSAAASRMAAAFAQLRPTAYPARLASTNANFAGARA